MRALPVFVVILLAAAGVQWLVRGEETRLDAEDRTRIDRYEIRPGSGIGPVRIGMSRGAAERAMRGTGQPVTAFVRGQTPPAVLAMHENAFQVYFDTSDRVEAVEVMGPSVDVQGRGDEPVFVAVFDGVDVFRTPATKLVEVVSRKAAPDLEAAEDPGITFEFPTLGLSLWRQTDEEGPFFETVYVSRPRS